MKSNKIVAYFAVVLTLAGLLMLSGCSKKDPLLATWQESVSGITMQFKDDGNLVISNQKTSLIVTYEKNDPNVLLVKGSADGSFPDQSMTYRIEEDRLILTVDGVDSVFTKVK